MRCGAPRLAGSRPSCLTTATPAKRKRPRRAIRSRQTHGRCHHLAGANRVIALDLHADAIQGFFDIPVDHLTAEKLIVEYIRKLHLPNAVIVSPDVGGAKRVGDVARLLDLPIAFVYKRRPKDDVVSEQRVSVTSTAMDAVVVDDLISTGGTLVGVSHALRAEGATSVRVLATHGVLAGDAVQKLVNSPIEELVITDSIPYHPTSSTQKSKSCRWRPCSRKRSAGCTKIAR